MGKRQKSWATRKRVWLIAALGGKCRHCGISDCLSFDCIKPAGSFHHGLSSDQRITFYMRQAERGNLQLLCTACNSRKGASMPQRYTRVTIV